MGPESAIGCEDELIRVAGQLAFEILYGFRVDHILRTLALLHELYQLVAEFSEDVR